VVWQGRRGDPFPYADPLPPVFLGLGLQRLNHVFRAFIENLVLSDADSCERGMGFNVWLQAQAFGSIHFADCFD
jgi:hypothetical protein